MAIRYAVASGNWSTGSTWDGGTLPTSADDVYSNGKTIAIDVSAVTVVSLNNGPSSPAVAGGGFTAINDGITINANLISSGGTLLNSTVTGTLNIFGNITCTSANNTTGLSVNGVNSNINITGNVTGGGSNATSNGIEINASGSLVNITGNVSCTNTAFSSGVVISSNARCVVNGTVTGGGTFNGRGVVYVNSTSNSAFTLNGLAIGGSVTNSAAVINYTTGNVILNGLAVAGTSIGIINNASGTITINTNQVASGTTGIYAISNASVGIINVNADILGALATSPSNAYVLNNASTGLININGSVIQRSVGPSSTIGIVNNASTGTINISGNVVGGSVTNSIAVSNASTGTINVVGNISGGTHASNTPAIYSTTAGVINVSGETASGLYPALYSTSTTATNRLKGNIKSFNGLLPFVAWKINCDPLSAQTITLQDTNNTDRIFGTSNVSNGAPLPSNVRSGIVYGSINEFTGTTIIATPDNVRKGVLTDNTIGTGQLTAEDFLNAISTGTDPLSIRLQNVSTVQSTGDQISNY
jgi:hypothetical protein